MRTLLIMLMLIANIHSYARIRGNSEKTKEARSDELFQDEYSREEIIIKEVVPEEQQEDIRNYRYDVPPKGRKLDEEKAQEE